MVPTLYTDRSSGIRVPLMVGSAFALTLLAGCSGQGAIRSASATSADTAFAAQGVRSERAVAKAEAVVARAPQDGAARVELGRAYLAAGRFESAATTFGDAMELGDASGHTTLSLSLALIGAGEPRAAVALLDEHRPDIPAADLGLALALAGETARGVAILADAVRSGENTPKLRQNLAYAYALDGRWAEAKVMAAQDVPADQLDRRLALWALSALPDRNRDRVAGLIGAPVRLDPGQPAALALRADGAAPVLAQAEPAPAVNDELPALAAVEPGLTTVAANISAQSAPSAPVTAAPVVAQAAARGPVLAKPAPVRVHVAQAFMPSEFAAPRFQPAHAPVPARTRSTLAALVRPAAPGTHLVQLGAFSSEKNAHRAWIFFLRQNPGLAAYRPVIAPAQVKGRAVWRVAAGGFNGRFAASGLCAQVKQRGGACFAYALPARPVLVPALPGQLAGPALRARR